MKMVNSGRIPTSTGAVADLGLGAKNGDLPALPSGIQMSEVDTPGSGGD